MSLMPWGNFGGLSPFVNDFPGMVDPFGIGTLDIPQFPRMPMQSMRRRLEREVGKLISSVKEDDKSFQVIIVLSVKSRHLSRFFLPA